jgi:hypothetical protein
MLVTAGLKLLNSSARRMTCFAFATSSMLSCAAPPTYQ